MKAYEIAKRDLRACYAKKGILAGLHHFNNYWARDSFFASLGALSIGDFDIVKKNLMLYLENISRQGQVPLRIGPNMVLNYLKIKARWMPNYENDKNKARSADPNPLFLIAFHEYIKISEDNKFLDSNKEKLIRIAKWSLDQDIDEDGLIEEQYYCNWADSVKKRGKVLYSNICHIHAMDCMVRLGFKEFKEYSKKASKRLDELFWSGEHYQDWVDEDNHYNYFSTDGNLLAIIWDIADKAKSRHIEEASHIFDLHEVPSRCVHPPYPKNFAFLPLRLIGLGDYHNGLSWLWLGCLNALAKHKLGMDEEAKEIMRKMADLIERFGRVYEVYGQDAKPVKRLIYKSEWPFAWSAGMFVYAYKEIFK